MLEYIVIMSLGALGAILANQGVAVFNDGFRPVIPQYFEGKITRAQLATMSFAISFGLVIGFAIPTSIAASIILIHCILLTTDIIGTFCPASPKGAILAGIIGAIYGFFILYGLQAVVDVFAYLPYNFLGALGKVGAPITVAFAIFPSVAIAYQHGFKKGVISGILTLLVYFLTLRFGVVQLSEFAIKLNATGMAMLFGMIMMIVYAAQVKSEGNSTNQDLANVFSKQVERIQKNWPLLAVMGGLVAAATSLSIVAGDPTSLNLLASGQNGEAAMAALARAIGFVPLVFTTAIATGVYGAAGCTFVFVVGLLLSGNPLLAAVVGAVVIVLEVFLINFFAKMMDKFPGVREMGEHIRTAMNKVLELALLVGSAFAADAMVPGVGSLFVIGCFLLNKTSKKPIVDLAVGPVAAIAFGVFVNVLVVIGLYVLPVVG